jgi:hypothetical protein
VVSQLRILFQFFGKPRKTWPAAEAEKWVGGEHFGHGRLSTIYPFYSFLLETLSRKQNERHEFLEFIYLQVLLTR